MTIKPPPRPAAHPDRDLDCQFALEPSLHAVLENGRNLTLNDILRNAK
jgi:hypothetical protein